MTDKESQQTTKISSEPFHQQADRYLSPTSKEAEERNKLTNTRVGIK
jgi:hypothetical protein